jgi:hypothetical protein
LDEADGADSKDWRRDDKMMAEQQDLMLKPL